MRFGRYVGVGQAKLEMAERWCTHYGPPGVLLSRLLPVIRHLIGIPTGILCMDFRRYALATLAGNGPVAEPADAGTVNIAVTPAALNSLDLQGSVLTAAAEIVKRTRIIPFVYIENPSSAKSDVVL